MGGLADFLLGLLFLGLGAVLLALEACAVSSAPLIMIPLMLASLIGMGIVIQGLWEDLRS